MNPSIIYQDKNMLAVNKPSGLLVHGADHIKSNEPTLVEWLVERFPIVKTVGDNTRYRPGIVHRLDRETSGVILIPLTQEYFSYLKKLFLEKRIKKTYWAITNGIPRETKGIITKPIGLKAGTTKRSVYGTKMIKDAVTEYRVEKIIEKNNSNYALVAVFPKTGRTHQIRVHLGYLNTPIVGDPLYGGKENAKKAPRCMLHAKTIEFDSSSGKTIVIDAPIPDDFESFLKK